MTNKIWGTEDVVKTIPNITVARPSLTTLPDGRYVVTWAEGNGNLGFQLYTSHGAKIGGSQYVTNALHTNSATEIQAYGSEGNFSVTWSQESGQSPNIVKTTYTRAYNFTGEPLGDAKIVVGSTTAKHGAATSQDANGWAVAHVDGTTISLSHYTEAGVTSTVPVATSAATPGLDMAYLGQSGGLSKHVIAYTGAGGTVKYSIVTGTTVATFPASGTMIGTIADVVALKNVDGTPNGKFVIVTDDGNNAHALRAYEFDSSGAQIRTFSISTDVRPSTGDFVSVSALRDGGFAVTYTAQTVDGPSRNDAGDIYFKAYHPGDIEANVTAIRINARAGDVDGIGAQHTSSIVEMADGRSAVSWYDGTASAGNGSNISTTIVDARTSAVTVNGTGHSDEFYGSEYSGDVLNGFAGGDVLYGGLGGDSLDGGADNDTLYGEAGSDTLVGGIGNDAMYGGADNDTLNAGADDDSLYGQDGADTLNGDAGNDTLLGGAGADELNGGTDIDLVSYQDAGAGVTINLLDGTLNTGDAQGDTYINIEGFRGSEYGDLFIGDGGANVFNGGGGSDTVSYAGHAPGVIVDLGTGTGTGGDVLQNFENVIGTDGNDTLTGNSAINVLTGGAGNDIYFVQDTGDYVAEAASGGIDTVNTSATYTLAAFVENLVGTGGGAISLTGNDLANSITGNDADNVINGGGGADIMAGGGGNDIYYVDNAGDVILDSSGIDTVVLATSMSLANFTNIENVMLSSTGAFSLDGSELANTLTGNNAANVLNGFGGDDIIMGLGGNDRLNGGTGNDTIYGSTGKDTLYGGSGKDVFVFDSRSNKRTNLDKIADYVVRDDSIWLDNAAFSSKIGKGAPTAPRKLNKAFFTVGDAAKDKNDYIIYSKSKGVLYYDSDGSGGKAKVEIATMKKNLKMTAAEFFVI